MPATHAQEGCRPRLPETCACLLVQETCTYVGQSYTSFSGRPTSFLHAIEHSWPASCCRAEKLCRSVAVAALRQCQFAEFLVAEAGQLSA